MTVVMIKAREGLGEYDGYKSKCTSLCYGALKKNVLKSYKEAREYL